MGTYHLVPPATRPHDGPRLPGVAWPGFGVPLHPGCMDLLILLLKKGAAAVVALQGPLGSAKGRLVRLQPVSELRT